MPSGVPVTLIVPSIPLNDAEVGIEMFPVTRRTGVPENVGCDTVPVAVPETVIVASVPPKVAESAVEIFPVTSLAPVPVKVG